MPLPPVSPPPSSCLLDFAMSVCRKSRAGKKPSAELGAACKQPKAGLDFRRVIAPNQANLELILVCPTHTSATGHPVAGKWGGSNGGKRLPTHTQNIGHRYDKHYIHESKKEKESRNQTKNGEDLPMVLPSSWKKSRKTASARPRPSTTHNITTAAREFQDTRPL